MDDQGNGPKPGQGPVWQLGVVVQDIEMAMDELARALGLEWSEIRTFEIAGAAVKVVMSRQGPPYFELVEGGAGSPWDASAGPRLDHVACFTPDIAKERERLEGLGFPVVMDGQAQGIMVNYHAVPAAGMRIEVIDASRKAEMRSGWNMDDI